MTMQGQKPKRLDRTREAAELIRQGLPQVEIARRLGIGPGQVLRIRRAHGLPGPRVCRTSRPISERQVRILRFVREFTDRHPYPPTIDEITKGCGISSRSATHYNLTVLERRGYMTRVPSAARTIVLTEKGRSKAAR